MSEEANVKTPIAPVETASKVPTPIVGKELIDIDYLSKLDLRIGTIKEAEKLEKSNKLVKLQVSLGSELGVRQIIAGISKHYSSEELVGRNIVVVSNLKPAKLMGVESQGMLLAASNLDGALELLSVSDTITAGATVR